MIELRQIWSQIEVQIPQPSFSDIISSNIIYRHRKLEEANSIATLKSDH